MRAKLVVLLLIALLAPAFAAPNWVLGATSPDGTKVFYDKNSIAKDKNGRIAVWIKTSHSKYGESEYSAEFDPAKDNVYWAKNKQRELEKTEAMYKIRTEVLKIKK